ncbi:hypothetical protein C3L33_20777, partial [Rhododendron williamsianum]
MEKINCNRPTHFTKEMNCEDSTVSSLRSPHHLLPYHHPHHQRASPPPHTTDWIYVLAKLEHYSLLFVATGIITYMGIYYITIGTLVNYGDIIHHFMLNAHAVQGLRLEEREVIAVLKLLTHTAKNFPGVFFHGRPAAVLPLTGRILPFFAEPAFSLSLNMERYLKQLDPFYPCLIRTGDHDAYRQFFLDTMLVVVASLFADESSNTVSSKVSLKCFCESFSGISSDPAHLSDLPPSSKTIDACSCSVFDSVFVFVSCELVVKLIHSISTILSEDEEPLPVFRNTVYDSSMGGCLQALHSSCLDDVVKLTATDLIKVFPESMQKTKSSELKVNSVPVGLL